MGKAQIVIDAIAFLFSGKARHAPMPFDGFPRLVTDKLPIPLGVRGGKN